MSRFFDALQKAREDTPAVEANVSSVVGHDHGMDALPGQVTEIADSLQGRRADSPARGADRVVGSLGVLPLIRPGGEVHPAYERIIQRLLSYRRSKRENVILVVGAVEGEGASTVARKLAISLSHNENEHVLLVDANLRNPVQHTAFGSVPADGLTDVLENQVPLSAAVKTGLGSGLALLTSGRPTDNPTQLLTQSAFHSVVSAIKTEFDWVLIDGPPVTVYPDAASLASAAGGAVLVLRAERTRMEVAEEAKRVLLDSGVDLLGAVLNGRRYHIPRFIYERL